MENSLSFLLLYECNVFYAYITWTMIPFKTMLTMWNGVNVHVNNSMLKYSKWIDFFKFWSTQNDAFAPIPNISHLSNYSPLHQLFNRLYTLHTPILDHRLKQKGWIPWNREYLKYIAVMILSPKYWKIDCTVLCTWITLIKCPMSHNILSKKPYHFQQQDIILRCVE